MRAKVIETASGPKFFVLKGEVLTSREAEAGNGIRYLSPLYMYQLMKEGCLERLGDSKPKARPAKRPLKNVRKVSSKDSKGSRCGNVK